MNTPVSVFPLLVEAYSLPGFTWFMNWTCFIATLAVVVLGTHLAWFLFVFGNQYVDSTISVAFGAIQPFVTVSTCAFVLAVLPAPHWGLQPYQGYNSSNYMLIFVIAGLVLLLRDQNSRLR